MESELLVGWDGNYVICYKSPVEPKLDEIAEEFSAYGLKARVDKHKWWVFLRSPDKNVVLHCAKELGDVYNFKVCKNSRQPEYLKDRMQGAQSRDNSDFFNKNGENDKQNERKEKPDFWNKQNDRRDNNKRPQTRDYSESTKDEHYEVNERKNNKYKVNSTLPSSVDPKKLVTVWETVIFNLPHDFSVDQIKKLCNSVDVKPYSANKHTTNGKGHPYCSVYVTSEQQMKTLCHSLKGAWYDDYGIMVANANDLYD